MKKLLALLFLSTAAHAFNPIRYVQISTNTFPQQRGGVYIASATVSTYFASTGPVTLGGAGNSVTISSNAILSGATFYQNATSQITTLSVSTITPTVGIVGATDGSSGPDADYGAYISSASQSAINFPSSGVSADLGSFSLTAGDWDLDFGARYTANGATTTDFLVGFGTVAGNSLTGFLDGDSGQECAGAFTTVITQWSVGVSRFRVSTLSPTTIYLKYQATYTGGPPQIAGMRMSRRRAR